MAVIALQVALGEGGRTEDREGALQALADEPFGWALILALAVGFGGYAVWRFAQGIFNRADEGGVEGVGKRVADVAKGLLYAALCAFAVGILVGSGGGTGDESRTTAFALELPFGRWLVGGVGLGVICAGLYNGFRALTAKFREDLRTGMMRQTEDRWYTTLGVFGHLARAVVLLLIGFFLTRAAWQYDPDEAIGLDEALRKVAAEDYGPYLLGMVAGGLFAYGLFCFVQARYRDV